MGLMTPEQMSRKASSATFVVALFGAVLGVAAMRLADLYGTPAALASLSESEAGPVRGVLYFCGALLGGSAAGILAMSEGKNDRSILLGIRHRSLELERAKANE